MASRLNLGSADALLPASEGWLNVDICPPDHIPDGYAFEMVDLTDDRQPWPWGADTVDEIRAWDIFEHLVDKRRSMNQAWRVLRNGGVLDLFIPTTDGRGAFCDPQHVSYWTPNDLFYYCEGYPEWRRFRITYGIIAQFRVLSQSHDEYPDKVWKLRARLEAIK